MLEEDAKRALLSVRVLGVALMGGIVVFAVVVAFLLTRPDYTPAAARAAGQLLPLAGFLTVASLFSAPFMENTIRRIPDGSSREQALSRFQTAAIVGFGVREGAALFALMVSLLTGQLNWGLGLAGLALLGMILAIPGETAVREYLKNAGRRR